MTPSQQTLDALYRQYHRQIHAYLSRMTGDTAEADDLTQEVFLRACRQIAQDHSPVDARSWLFRAATCAGFDHFRRRSRRVRAEPITDESQLPSTSDPFEQSQSAAAVVAALRRLAKRHRAALILKDLYGFRHTEIAAAMGISEGAAQILLHRARNEFREAYTDALAGRVPSCPVTTHVALDFVGTTLTPAQRRDLHKHAETCPECRRRLAGGLVPAGALAFLLPLPADPGIGGPLLPPLASTPPAASPSGSGLLDGVLSPIASVLASKAAIVVLAAGLTLGGHLTTQNVLAGETGDGGAVNTMPQSLPTSVETTTVATPGAWGNTARPTGPSVGSALASERPAGDYGPSAPAEENPRYQVPFVEEAVPDDSETSFARAQKSGTTDGGISTSPNGAGNPGPGSTSAADGKQYAGRSVPTTGGQNGHTSRETTVAGANTPETGVNCVQSSGQGDDAGAALGEDPSQGPGDDHSQAPADAASSTSNDIESKASGTDQPDDRPLRPVTGG